MMDILMSMYDWANEAFKVVLEVAWFIGWRWLLLYSIYVTKGETGLTYVAIWITLWCVFYGGEYLSMSLDGVIMLANVMVGACLLTGLGIGGMVFGFFMGWLGYSSTVKGGFINNILNNDK